MVDVQIAEFKFTGISGLSPGICSVRKVSIGDDGAMFRTHAPHILGAGFLRRAHNHKKSTTERQVLIRKLT